MGCNDKCKCQRNCAFSFKRKRAAWNERKDKTMTVETGRSSRKWQRFLLYSERMVRGVRVWERHVLQ